MPYKFGEYVSTYVDPQSVRISEALRGRFMENFKAQDQLSMAVDQMKAALPFEKDMEKKRQLEQDINDKLTILSQRGDYENLGFAVHNTAREFTDKYSPIKENYDRYQNALTDLSEQYKKGDINAEDYSLATGYITKGYKGFEIDPNTGQVKEGSMFSAPMIYKDPKLMDRIKERLEILYEKTTKVKRGTAGMDANGVWTMVTASGITQIPEEDVMDVYNQVIQEPDVEMYLNQRADMKLYAANESGSSTKILQAKINNNNEGIKQLNAALNSGNYSAKDKKIITDQINAFTEENTNLGKALADPTLADNYLKSMFREDILGPVKEYALKKAGIRSQESESTYHNDYAFFKQNRQWAHEAELKKQEAIYSQTDVTAEQDISGKTTQEKNEYLKSVNQQIYDLKQKLNDNTLSEGIRNDINTQIAKFQDEANRVYSQIKTSADKSISMDDLYKADRKTFETLKEMYPHASSGELYLIAQRTFDVAGEQDYNDFTAAFDARYGSGEFNKHMQGDQFRKAPIVTRMSREEKAMATGMSWAGENYTYRGTEGYLDHMDQSLGALSNNVNKTFKEIKVSRQYTNYLDTGDDVRNVQLQNGLNEYFKPGLAPRENEKYMLSDGSIKSGSELAALGYKFQDWGGNLESNTYRISLTKGGDNPESITALYDGNQITSQSLQKTINSPEVVFGSRVHGHDLRQSGAESIITDASYGGKAMDIIVTSNGGGEAPYVSFIYPNSKSADFPSGIDFFSETSTIPIKYKMNDPAIQSALQLGKITLYNPR